MKKIILLLSIVLFKNSLQAQNVNFEWAKQLGGSQDQYGRSVKVDAAGNVYTTGYFTGTADFDPGPGVFNLTSFGGTDIYLSKLDASGNFLWVKQFGGADHDEVRAIEIDALGNIYLTGLYSSTADFDPGPGVYNLISNTQRTFFVCKLDNNGNLIWAKGHDGTTQSQGFAVKVDAAGNVYVTGDFVGLADFDPGPGVFQLLGYRTTFVLKLDINGKFVWVKDLQVNANSPNSFSMSSGRGIVLDDLGNVYSTGFLYSSNIQ